jgi:NAD(P) transhydrogenase subunit alpha
VTIIGYTDLPSRLPTQASNLYANNIVNLLTDMTPEKDGKLVVDLEDQVVRGTLVTHQGEVTWPPPKIADPSPPAAKKPPAQPVVAPSAPVKPVNPMMHWVWTGVAVVVGMLLLWFVGKHAPQDFVSHFTVFVLACFVGWQLVWNVTPALHTPLMSVTNAISGIIVIGGMLQIGAVWYSFNSLLAVLAVLIATINVVGGFFVTHRMLGMFKRQD